MKKTTVGFFILAVLLAESGWATLRGDPTSVVARIILIVAGMGIGSNGAELIQQWVTNRKWKAMVARQQNKESKK